MKIYKYPVGVMPGDHKITAPIISVLGVFLDGSASPCLYAIVDPERKINEDDDTIHVKVFWTGGEMDGLAMYYKYLNTLTVNGLVCHYFVHGNVIPI